MKHQGENDFCCLETELCSTENNLCENKQQEHICIEVFAYVQPSARKILISSKDSSGSVHENKIKKAVTPRHTANKHSSLWLYVKEASIYSLLDIDDFKIFVLTPQCSYCSTSQNVPFWTMLSRPCLRHPHLFGKRLATWWILNKSRSQ